MPSRWGQDPGLCEPGGLKLEKAVERWPIRLEGGRCADIGSSTGGFTDLHAPAGAEKVYAVDSGYNQLDWRLRSDPRVVCMERTNARYLTGEQILEPLDFFSVDVAFISSPTDPAPMRPLVGGGPGGVPGQAPVRGRPGKRWAKKVVLGPGGPSGGAGALPWTMPGRRDFL